MINERYLFRGKRKNGNGWVVGYLSNVQSDFASIKYVKDNGYKCEAVVDPATIGQCTGLRDKNSALIFEGDIINVLSPSRPKINYALLWNRFEWFVESVDGIIIPLSELIPIDSGGYMLRAIVVGNIHDNPELLEVGNEE